MDVMIYFLICISKALLLHGAWNLHGGYKAAVNPYSTSTNSNLACASLCDADSNCNGYSIDTSNTGCYLSRCDTYLQVPSCSSCNFCSKSPLSSSPVCNTETSTLNASVLGSVTPDNTLDSKEATVTVDIDTSSAIVNTIPQDTTMTLSEEKTTKVDINTSSTSVVLVTTLHSTVLDSITTALNNLYATTFSTTTATDLNLIITKSDPEDNITLDRGVAETTKPDSNLSFYATADYSSTENLHHTNGNLTCVCVCKYINMSLELSLAKRKEALTLNRTKLSSSIRKLISAHDSRKSCRDIGVVGIAVMVIVVLLIFCIDISSLFIPDMKKN